MLDFSHQFIVESGGSLCPGKLYHSLPAASPRLTSPDARAARVGDYSRGATVVWDKGDHDDGTFSRSDFVFDAETGAYTCPAGSLRRLNKERAQMD